MKLTSALVCLTVVIALVSLASSTPAHSRDLKVQRRFIGSFKKFFKKTTHDTGVFFKKAAHEVGHVSKVSAKGVAQAGKAVYKVFKPYVKDVTAKFVKAAEVFGKKTLKNAGKAAKKYSLILLKQIVEDIKSGHLKIKEHVKDAMTGFFKDLEKSAEKDGKKMLECLAIPHNPDPTCKQAGVTSVFELKH